MNRRWLAPLVPLYAAGAALRDLQIRNGWKPVQRLRWPVISIGNLSTGGAGKTPLTIALARLLRSNGFRVDVLSRGYGRESREPTRVNPDGTAAEFGDEPLLIAREAGVPVYVAPQRYDAGIVAEADFAAQHAEEFSRGTFAHILDDGFQHRQLARDVDILILNPADLQDSLLPAGNLREPLRAMHRATVIVLPADEPELEEKMRRFGWNGVVWQARRHMDVPVLDAPVVAFCGIARPQQFFAGLEAAGMRIASRFVFRDHQRYTTEDMRRLAEDAQLTGAKAFITTEKDQVRLGTLSKVLPQEIPLTTAPLRIEIENAEIAIEELASRIGRSSAQRPL